MTLILFMGALMFVLGAVIGSFLNVCIVRMPHGKSIVTPRSHCVRCNRMIPWYDNIPLFSYLILRGRCRSCGERFSARYFFVELISGLSFLGLYLAYGLQPEIAAYAVMISCFIVATFVDFEHRIIPDEISVGGMVLGLLLSALLPGLHDLSPDNLAWGRLCMRIIVGACLLVHVLEYFFHRHDFDREDAVLFGIIAGMLALEGVLGFVVKRTVLSGWIVHLWSLDAALIGALLGGGVIYGMGLVGDVIFRKESMGGGDVKLMALVGAFLGWKLALVTFFVAPFFGAVYGIAEKLRTKDSAIAYGPFLVLGALISLFFGDVIIAWVVGQYGISYNF
ncbi:MAG: prepilin peptidase [Candidatus Omnitrophota bacterium]